MDLLNPSAAANMAGVTRMAIQHARTRGELKPAWTSAKGYHRYSIEEVKAWMKWRLDRDNKKEANRLHARKLKNLFDEHKRKLGRNGLPLNQPYAVLQFFDRLIKITKREFPPFESWHPDDLRDILNTLRPIFQFGQGIAEIWKTKTKTVKPF